MRPVSTASGWSRMTSPDQPYDGSSTGTMSSSPTNRAEANFNASSGFTSTHQPDDGSSTGTLRSSMISQAEGNPGNGRATFSQSCMNGAWGVPTERTSSCNTTLTTPQLVYDWSSDGRGSSTISQAETRNARVASPQQPNDRSSASTFQSSNASRAGRISSSSSGFTPSPSRDIDTNIVQENEVERNSNNNACLDQSYQQSEEEGSASSLRSCELENYMCPVHPMRNNYITTYPEVYNNPSVPNTSQREHEESSIVTLSNGVAVSPWQDSSSASENQPSSSIPHHSIIETLQLRDSETLANESLENSSNSGITNNDASSSRDQETDGNITDRTAIFLTADEWEKHCISRAQSLTKRDEEELRLEKNSSDTEQRATNCHHRFNFCLAFWFTVLIFLSVFILIIVVAIDYSVASAGSSNGNFSQTT